MNSSNAHHTGEASSGGQALTFAPCGQCGLLEGDREELTGRYPVVTPVGLRVRSFELTRGGADHGDGVERRRVID